MEEINQGHYFELMDRSHVIIENISDHLYSHPATDAHLKDHLEDAINALVEFQNHAAEKHDSMEGV